MHTETRSGTAVPIRFHPGGLARALAGDAEPQCAACPRRSVCLPADLEENCGHSTACGSRGAASRAARCCSGKVEAFHFLYAVRSGTFKSAAATPDGREHVSGFHLAGDMLGLDALADGRHASEAVALEDSEVCAIPYRQLAQLAAENPRIQGVLARLLSRHIVGEQRAVLLLGSMTAEERVAGFLLDLSERMRARGYSAREFHLRMTRAEIGSYLGLTLETVSRVLSAFSRQRLLEVMRKHIRLTDAEGLFRTYGSNLH